MFQTGRARSELGIEIDGPIHYNQKEYDNARQEIIKSKGIRIMRFSNKQVLEDVESVLKLIKQSISPLYEVERGALSLSKGGVRQ